MLQKIRSRLPLKHQRAFVYIRLLREEAAIGGRLFGVILYGTRREFFCLDEHTWIWHEEWLDLQGQPHSIVTRYDVRSNGVYKAQDHQLYRVIDEQEALRLYRAIERYNEAVDVLLQ
ncbi:MAG TPA: hypothetical protein VGS08_00215 [Candidatus Saccharimonadales bacterium]|nr:hypothetical protein [Candidatus Saccharimonadales bacterium]